jgi:hypothetical protein
MPAHTNRPLPVGPSAVDTAYTLTLLSEYAYTLDTLPLELSRYFADLRELDAVLSSSMVSITAKIHRLTALIEQGNAAGAADTGASASGSGAPDAVEIRARKEDRLYLLADIAEEVSRLKPGAEDKIRVACLAADTLKAHAAHMTALLDQAPVADYEEANVDRQTVFPHVGKGFAGTALFEVRGKRRAAAAGVITAHAHAVLESPAKRRRGARDEDDPAYGRSPRKDKTANARNGVRPKKCVSLSLRLPPPLTSLAGTTAHRRRPSHSFPSPLNRSHPHPGSPRKLHSPDTIALLRVRTNGRARTRTTHARFQPMAHTLARLAGLHSMAARLSGPVARRRRSLRSLPALPPRSDCIPPARMTVRTARTRSRKPTTAVHTVSATGPATAR